MSSASRSERRRAAGLAAVLAAAAVAGRPAWAAGGAASASALIIGKLPVGARAIALSGAYAAAAGEPAAVAWNSAGLARVERASVEVLHVEQSEAVRVENVLVALPVAGGGTFAAAASYLSMPPIVEIAEDAAGNPVEGPPLTAYQFKGAIGFGQDLSRIAALPALGSAWERGSLGGTLTLLGEAIGGVRHTSASVDLGYLYQDEGAGFAAALVGRHLGAPVGGSPLPATAEAGFAQAFGSFLLTVDLLTAADDAFRMRGGVEWTYGGDPASVALRAGAQHSLASSLIAPYSLGLGYRSLLPGGIALAVEYAYMPVEGFAPLHAVSFGATL